MVEWADFRCPMKTGFDETLLGFRTFGLEHMYGPIFALFIMSIDLGAVLSLENEFGMQNCKKWDFCRCTKTVTWLMNLQGSFVLFSMKLIINHSCKK